MKRVYASSALVLSGIVLSPWAHAQVTITNLGLLPGGSESEAFAVSNNGSAVVGVGISSAGDRAFRWTLAGGMQDLGALSGGISSAATGVSADGSAVAGWSTSSGGFRAFRWTGAGGMQDLGALSGGNFSLGWGISGNGLVVVGQVRVPGDRAFRWTQAGGMQNLGTLPGGGNTEAFGVSGDGSVVVGRGQTEDGGRAFRWTQAGGMQNLGLLPGGTSSIATAVSADGLAVVGFDYTVGTARYRAFRWTGAGGMQDLGSLPGEGQIGYIFANGTNGDGSAVVGRIDEGNISAFLWTQSLGMVDLNTYLPTLGVNLTGWDLGWANGISADGSSIVGRGKYNGVDRAWLVTGVVPEPGTMLAFCAGLAACAWRRRRKRHLDPGQNVETTGSQACNPFGGS